MPARRIADRYELEQPLGGGAMSAVWLARDDELERQVAVKLLANDADRTRFEREARAVAALSHPNICQLYDYGEADEGPYMILEYLPGGTLEDRLAAGEPLPDGEAARIAREIAAGLAHAHERKLVHRDLKPANILFDAEDRAKIGDFGIARIAGAGILTQAGTVLGTAAYISPEQAAGEPATPASDVYSFGAILYRMLTGLTPFVSDSAMELVRMHREDEPPPVERHRPDAPAALAAVAFAALAKDPADRPADGDALLAELVRDADATTLLAGAPAAGALAGRGETAAATQVLPGAPAPGRRTGRRAMLPLAIAAVVLLAAAGVGAAYVLTGGDDGNGAGPSPTLTLPTVGTDTTATAEPTTEEETTTAPETTEPTTTEQTTTKETTRKETTTQPPTTESTTTVPPPPTTVPTTTTEETLPTTTEETVPTTTAAPAATTTATAPTTTAAT